jgi:hypothetical protein
VSQALFDGDRIEDVYATRGSFHDNRLSILDHHVDLVSIRTVDTLCRRVWRIGGYGECRVAVRAVWTPGMGRLRAAIAPMRDINERERRFILTMAAVIAIIIVIAIYGYWSGAWISPVD